SGSPNDRRHSPGGPAYGRTETTPRRTPSDASVERPLIESATDPCGRVRAGPSPESPRCGFLHPLELTEEPHGPRTARAGAASQSETALGARIRSHPNRTARRLLTRVRSLGGPRTRKSCVRLVAIRHA